MATTITINPTISVWHNKVDRSWDAARTSSTSDVASTATPGQVGITFPRDYSFYRLYMSFDLSAVPSGSVLDSIKIYLKRVDSVKTTYSPIIAYAGNANVRRNVAEYSLYIDNTIGGRSVASINLDDNSGYYASDNFDLVVYPVSSGDILAVGVIDSNDFNDVSGGVSDLYLIDTNPAGDQPYIEVTYSAGGYTKPVMGISNFTGLNGIPSANIASVMGVI